ncbi:hypothetical protein FFZ77_07530 [Streptomyces katsurahamanus]|uniref:Uncharacterized protein n=1 Tax=Streptomyces katsurahamanus TaxID=2577098 RepID=A0ABW9NQJ9_9ACTN|nr:hypothetical protein [Streptomyces katsurahamanus]
MTATNGECFRLPACAPPGSNRWRQGVRGGRPGGRTGGRPGGRTGGRPGGRTGGRAGGRTGVTPGLC